MLQPEQRRARPDRRIQCRLNESEGVPPGGEIVGSERIGRAPEALQQFGDGMHPGFSETNNACALAG
jgi:hypothetical protein